MKRARVVYLNGVELIENGVKAWLQKNVYIEDVLALSLNNDWSNHQTLIKYRNVDLIVLPSNLCATAGTFIQRMKSICPHIRVLLVDLTNGAQKRESEHDGVFQISDTEESFHTNVNHLLGFNWPNGEMLKETGRLTSHEKEVIKLICLEKSTNEIAELLFRSPRTIEGTRTKIMKKLGVTSAIGLVRYAMKNGLVD